MSVTNDHVCCAESHFSAQYGKHRCSQKKDVELKADVSQNFLISVLCIPFFYIPLVVLIEYKKEEKPKNQQQLLKDYQHIIEFA